MCYFPETYSVYTYNNNSKPLLVFLVRSGGCVCNHVMCVHTHIQRTAGKCFKEQQRALLKWFMSDDDKLQLIPAAITTAHKHSNFFAFLKLFAKSDVCVSWEFQILDDCFNSIIKRMHSASPEMCMCITLNVFLVSYFLIWQENNVWCIRPACFCFLAL